MAVVVQLLTARQAPRPTHHRAASAADPEPGGALLAVDAQLEGVRQHAGGGPRERACPAALAAARRRAPRIRYPVTASAEVGAVAAVVIRVAGRLGRPPLITGWLQAGPGGCLVQQGGRSGELAQHRGRGRALGGQGTGAQGQAGQGTADAADAVHDGPFPDRVNRAVSGGGAGCAAHMWSGTFVPALGACPWSACRPSRLMVRVCGLVMVSSCISCLGWLGRAGGGRRPGRRVRPDP